MIPTYRQFVVEVNSIVQHQTYRTGMVPTHVTYMGVSVRNSLAGRLMAYRKVRGKFPYNNKFVTYDESGEKYS